MNTDSNDYALTYAIARGAQAGAICLLAAAIVPLAVLSWWALVFVAIGVALWKNAKNMLAEIPKPLMEKFLEVGWF